MFVASAAATAGGLVAARLTPGTAARAAVGSPSATTATTAPAAHRRPTPLSHRSNPIGRSLPITLAARRGEVSALISARG